MKKLMIVAFMAMLGMVVNAATCNWAVQGDWVSSDGENPLEVAIYAFDALAYSSSDIATALAGGDRSVLGNAMATGVVSGEGTFFFQGTGITDDGATPVASASVFTLLLDTDNSASASGFYVSSGKTVKLTDAVLAGQANFYWDEINVTGFTPISSPGPSPIPEPTSGLLMLLGVAGLALRRKRA